MGLIYVNPEGPGGNPDPKASALRSARAFGRMAMNDEETVALIAGGHTFGKVHGAHKPGDCVGPEPAAAPIEQQGLGWKNSCGKGNAEDTIDQRPGRRLDPDADAVVHAVPEQPVQLRVGADQKPRRRHQWTAKERRPRRHRPDDAHVKGQRNAPIMLTTDMALKADPAYREISKRFLANPRSSSWPSPRPGSSSPTATWARGALRRRSRARGSAAVAGPGARGGLRDDRPG
jgi:catalase-peroxidase